MRKALALTVIWSGCWTAPTPLVPQAGGSPWLESIPSEPALDDGALIAALFAETPR